MNDLDLHEDIEFSLDEDEAEINMTPLVNVGLVLVLIFMVTSPFFEKELMPVKLPEAVTSDTEREGNISISISPEGGYALNEDDVTKNELPGKLSEMMRVSPTKYVIIRADERIPHGEVEDLMKLSQRLGARRIAFGTVPKI